MTAAIEFRGVTKTYPLSVEALKNVSFSVAPGEVCGFLGPNGAGKTTSIGILMGFLFADIGEVRVLDSEPGDVRAKAQIGFLPENFAFYKFLSGRKLLALHLALSGRHVADPDNIITGLLEQVNLADKDRMPISRYSRGMVQRLGIAQALIGDPQLLVFDEPTSGLDPAGRKEVLDLVQTFKHSGKTVFFSSHILHEVEQICDRVIIIDGGRLVRAGRLDELLRTGSRVEIVVNQLPEPAACAVAECGAEVYQTAQNIRVLVDSSRKRQVIESLWAAGCDVLRVNPLQDSLEQVFLNLVGGDHENLDTGPDYVS